MPNETHGIRRSVAITPNDSTTIDPTRGLLVDVAGASSTTPGRPRASSRA